MAHRTLDQDHTSGKGPRGDPTVAGPVCSGSCLAHRLVSTNLGGVSCGGKISLGDRLLWNPLDDLIVDLVRSNGHTGLATLKVK